MEEQLSVQYSAPQKGDRIDGWATEYAKKSLYSAWESNRVQCRLQNNAPNKGDTVDGGATQA